MAPTFTFSPPPDHVLHSRRGRRSQWDEARADAHRHPGEWLRFGPIAKTISAQNVRGKGKADQGLDVRVGEEDGQRWAWIMAPLPATLTADERRAQVQRAQAAVQRVAPQRAPQPPSTNGSGTYACRFDCGEGPWSTAGAMGRHVLDKHKAETDAEVAARKSR